MRESTVKKTGMAGMAWSFMIQSGTQLINFIVTVLLARLLLPEEFGLIGMIAIFIAIARALVDGGFVSSLIRTKDADNIDYSTVFFTNLFSSTVLYFLLFFSAPYIAIFYNEEILTSLLRVIGLVLIINAFSLVQSTKLNKTLNFKTQFKIQFPSLLISASISIWMAYNNYGVWSLVAKDIVYAILATLQLWFYSKWTPSFIFDKEKFKYHFNFGYKISLTQIINTGFENSYKLIIGKFFSAAQLGYYTRARSLEELPTGFFYNAFNRVAYPLLSNIGDNDQKLKHIYAQLMGIIVFIVTPILVYLGIVAEPFFRWLLTEKWLPAVPYFQLLLISGVFHPIHKYNLNICQLKGRSDLVLKLAMLQNFLLLIGAFTAIWWGIYGLLFSLIGVNIVITFMNAHISGKLIDYRLADQISDIYPVIILNLVTGIIVYITQLIWLNQCSDLLNLITMAILFISLYLISAFGLKIQPAIEILSFRKKL